MLVAVAAHQRGRGGGVAMNDDFKMTVLLDNGVKWQGVWSMAVFDIEPVGGDIEVWRVKVNDRTNITYCYYFYTREDALRSLVELM